MSVLDLAPVRLADLTAEPSLADGSITVRFQGSADLEVRAELESLLEKLHAEAQRHHVDRVVIDFVKLEFMNSSCFKSFLSWISWVQQLDAAHRYRVVVVPNEQLHWQKRSLNAMRCFAADLISIEPPRVA